MTTPLSGAIAQIDRLEDIGTILYLGAGDGAELEALAATSARQIVLVEPNPELLPALEAAAQDARVTLLPVAVGESAGQSAFRQANFADLSSLHAPTDALKRLFPGLRHVETHQVETLPLPAILERAAIDASACNILIIDAPGAEGQIVQDLCAAAHPPPFTHVILRSGIEPMYEGTFGLKTLATMLQDQGYRVSAQDDSDPDLPRIHMRLDPFKQEAEQLRARLAEAAAREAALIAERDKRIAGLEDEIANRKAERDNCNARAEKTKMACAALEAENAERARNIERLETRVSELEIARKSAKEITVERDKRIAVLEGELSRRTNERDSCRQEIEKLQGQQSSELAKARNRAAELEAELARAQKRLRAVEDELVAAGAQMDIVRELMRQPSGGRA